VWSAKGVSNSKVSASTSEHDCSIEVSCITNGVSRVNDCISSTGGGCAECKGVNDN